MTISSFRGRYDFLSNFYNLPIKWEGLTYRNNESAFQSAKIVDIEQRKEFCNLDPSTSKRKGRRVELRSDWEEIKLQVMYEIVKCKFEQNEDLRKKLISTGDEILEEGNTWGDRTWGTCNGIGRNMLGKILMKVREELKEE